MSNNSSIKLTHYLSPVGKLVLGDYNGKLCLCDWADRKHPDIIFNRLQKSLNTSFQDAHTALHDHTINQLSAYFAHALTQFDLPLLPVGTDFQQAVWSQLDSIEYGQTVSYQYIANALNKPQSVRAVANAIGANALSLLIPCHRIIGSNGAVTGYAGGVPAKTYLLAWESND